MKKSSLVYVAACVAVVVATVAFIAIGIGSLMDVGGAKHKSAREVEKEERGEFREVISGDFNGDGMNENAELYRLKRGEEYEYNIYFSEKSVSTLDSAMLNYSVMYLTNEGDLNGDGADEVGVFLHCGYSYWGTYVVYTYINKVWMELVSISHNPGWVECDMQDLVRPNPCNRKSVIVREISLDHSKMVDRVRYLYP